MELINKNSAAKKLSILLLELRGLAHFRIYLLPFWGLI
jgi:hypothetical protein